MVLTIFSFNIGVQSVKDESRTIADQNLWFIDRKVWLDNLFHIIVKEAMWIFLPLNTHDFELVIYLLLVVVISYSSGKVVAKFAVLLIGYVWNNSATGIVIFLLSPIILVQNEIVLVIVRLFPFFIKASVSSGCTISKAVLALLIPSSMSRIGVSKRLTGTLNSPVVVLLFSTMIWIHFGHIIVLNRPKYLGMIILIAGTLIHLVYSIFDIDSINVF